MLDQALTGMTSYSSAPMRLATWTGFFVFFFSLLYAIGSIISVIFLGKDILDGKFPERVLTQAVKRMLPGGPLSRQQMTNLRVYAGSEHPHDAQAPEILDVASRNKKNTRSE